MSTDLLCPEVGGILHSELKERQCAPCSFSSYSPLLALSAHAEDPASWWTSDSGSQVKVWVNAQRVVVTVVTSDGLQHEYRGYWIRFRDRFAWKVPGSGTFQASFVPFNSNLLQVLGRDDLETLKTRHARSH